ncbi:hypothetical protein GC167_02935 [bacterium]|nr:hypothetical protein [bacterium]
MNTLLKRSLSGVLYVALLLGGIWWRDRSFVFVMGLLMIMSLIEAGTLLNINRVAPRVNAFFATLIPFTLSALHFLGIIDIPPTARLVFLGIGAFHVLWLVLRLYGRSGELGLVRTPWIHAALYTGFGFMAPLLLFHAENRYQSWMTALFVLVWTHDTFAYVFGRFWGKTPLSPRLSPRKTIEGSAGGLIMTLVAALIVIPWIWKAEANYFAHFTALAVFTVVFGTLGDLYESKLKRKADVKDSGHLIPGHGGILDRVDSFLFIMPIAALYLHLVFYFGLSFPIP